MNKKFNILVDAKYYQIELLAEWTRECFTLINISNGVTYIKISEFS